MDLRKKAFRILPFFNGPEIAGNHQIEPSADQAGGLIAPVYAEIREQNRLFPV